PLPLPHSTLRLPPFPYTTLFRSYPIRRTSASLEMSLGVVPLDQRVKAGDRAAGDGDEHEREELPAEERPAAVDQLRDRGHPDLRSEEHTSELQSRFDLVCRLVLE